MEKLKRKLTVLLLINKKSLAVVLPFLYSHWHFPRFFFKKDIFNFITCLLIVEFGFLSSDGSFAESIILVLNSPWLTTNWLNYIQGSFVRSSLSLSLILCSFRCMYMCFCTYVCVLLGLVFKLGSFHCIPIFVHLLTAFCHYLWRTFINEMKTNG